MPRLLRNLLPWLMVPAVFMIGLRLGPHISNWYHTAFPPPANTSGDHAELYAKAGTSVVLYATSTCPYCAKVRELFAARSVRYTEYQIDKSEQAKQEFLARDGVAGPPAPASRCHPPRRLRMTASRRATRQSRTAWLHVETTAIASFAVLLRGPSAKKRVLLDEL
jgi:hypothetical protein